MFSHSLFWLGIGALIKRWQGQTKYMSPNLPDDATDSLQTCHHMLILTCNMQANGQQ